MAKFRYSTDSGSTWVVVDDDLPYNIPVTAEQDVIVEPIGAAVSNLGTIDGDFLSLTYEAADPADDVAAFTNIAGTFYWAVTTSITPPSAAAIIAGTGFVQAGSQATVPGAFAFELPTLSGAPDLFLHAVVDGAERTNIATVRAYIGSTSTFATLANFTGTPVITNYTDSDGSWRAYAWRSAGSFSFEVTGAGDVQYLMGAGGGGAGGGVGQGGGGGAGGILPIPAANVAGGTYAGTVALTTGIKNLTVGAGGLGGTSATPAASNGADTTAFGFTAIGGGRGGTRGSPFVDAVSGGSGGGQFSSPTQGGGAGTAGQGFAGAPPAGTAVSVASGGGGATGIGQPGTQTGDESTRTFGAGGPGRTSTITGTAVEYCKGGDGRASAVGQPAFNVGTQGADGTLPGQGGIGALNNNTTFRGGNGSPGFVVIRVKTA